MDQAEREADARNAEGAGAMDVEEEEDNPETAIVLAEDKKYYPSAEEVYGEGTETLVMDEDAQPLEEPIIAPLKTKRVEVRDANAPVMRVSEEYVLGMLSNPNLTRNVAVCGHLHHGKTQVWNRGGVVPGGVNEITRLARVVKPGGGRATASCQSQNRG